MIRVNDKDALIPTAPSPSLSTPPLSYGIKLGERRSRTRGELVLQLVMNVGKENKKTHSGAVHCDRALQGIRMWKSKWPFSKAFASQGEAMQLALQPCAPRLLLLGLLRCPPSSASSCSSPVFEGVSTWSSAHSPAPPSCVSFLRQGINGRCCVGCWVCSNPALRGKHPTRNVRAPVTRRSCHREMGPLKSLCCPQPVNCYLNNSFPWGPGALHVAHSCQLC